MAFGGERSGGLETPPYWPLSSRQFISSSSRSLGESFEPHLQKVKAGTPLHALAASLMNRTIRTHDNKSETIHGRDPKGLEVYYLCCC